MDLEKERMLEDFYADLRHQRRRDAVVDIFLCLLMAASVGLGAFAVLTVCKMVLSALRW